MSRARESRQIGSTAPGEFFPGVLGLNRRVAGGTQAAVVDQTVMHPLKVGWNGIEQTKHQFDFVDAVGPLARCSKQKQQFANRPVWHGNADLVSTLDLLVNAGDFPLGDQIDRQRLGPKSIQERHRQPPEGTQRRRRVGMQQAFDRHAHLGDCFRIALIAQETEHPALERGANAGGIAVELVVVSVKTRRAQAQIREKEFDWLGPLATAQCHHVAIVGKELERGIARARGNALEVFAHRGKRPGQHILAFGGHRKLPAGGQGEQALCLHRHHPNAFKIDKLQRTAGLVHEAAGQHDLRAVAVVLRALRLDGGLRPRQRLADFAKTPRQSGQIRRLNAHHDTLKRDTELFSSRASSASWTMEPAVCCVPSLVCSVTSRMRWML